MPNPRPYDPIARRARYVPRPGPRARKLSEYEAGTTGTNLYRADAFELRTRAATDPTFKISTFVREAVRLALQNEATNK